MTIMSFFDNIFLYFCKIHEITTILSTNAHCKCIDVDKRQLAIFRKVANAINHFIVFEWYFSQSVKAFLTRLSQFFNLRNQY